MSQWLLDSDSFATLYKRLHNSSKCLQQANAQGIVDKTPRYIYTLDEVMSRDTVQVVVTNKSHAA